MYSSQQHHWSFMALEKKFERKNVVCTSNKVLLQLLGKGMYV